MFKNFKFGLFAKVLIFYVCILLIPFLLCGSFLTQYIMTNYKNEILDLNINTTSYIRQTIDKNIEDIGVMKLLISKNEKIMDFIENDTLFRKGRAYYAKQIAEEIDKCRIYRNSIGGIHLYSSASDCIITGSSYFSKEEYFDRYLLYSGLSFEQWCERLEKASLDSPPIISVVDDGVSSTEVTSATVIQPLMKNSSGDFAVLLIVLDPDYIINTYKELISNNTVSYFAISSSEKILIESNEPPFDINVTKLFEEDGYKREENNGYITVTEKSGVVGLNYIVIISEQKILAKVHNINIILMLCILILSLLLIVLAYIFTNKTVTPIKALVKLDVEDKNYNFSSIGEFQGFLVNIINSNKHLSDVVGKQKKYINDNFFKSFIQNSMYVDENMLNTLFADASISVNSRCFRAAIVDLKRREKGCELTEDFDVLLHFQEVLNDYGIKLFIIPNENNQTILLLAYDNVNEKVKTALSEIVSNLENKENIHMFISVGREVDSLNKFTKSYEDAFFGFGNNNIGVSVFMGDSNKTYAEYFNFIKKDKLIFDVRNGNQEDVAEFFREIKSTVFDNYMTTYGIQNYVRYLLDEILKSAIDEAVLSETQIKKLLNDCKKAIDKQNMDESLADLEKCFADATQYINEGKQKKKNDVISNIIKYVKINYSDPDLSLMKIADEFGVSYKYASETFKRKVGMKFTDYLHEIRNEEAKRLLSTTDLLILDIAEKIGYLGSNAFVKSFKKINGITPGDFRKNCKR